MDIPNVASDGNNNVSASTSRDMSLDSRQTRETPPMTSSRPSYEIVPVRTASELTAAIKLFTAYAESLQIDLSFQDFQAEMASMPGKYSPQAGGELLLARASPSTSASFSDTPSRKTGEALGCVALRALPTTLSSTSASNICEMKRLYVTPSARGLKLGRGLALRIIRLAETLGYDEMRLDTLPSMQAAQAMYREFGFVDIEPYCFNPVDGSRFLSLRLPMAQQPDEKTAGGEDDIQ